MFEVLLVSSMPSTPLMKRVQQTSISYQQISWPLYLQGVLFLLGIVTFTLVFEVVFSRPFTPTCKIWHAHGEDGGLATFLPPGVLLSMQEPPQPLPDSESCEKTRGAIMMLRERYKRQRQRQRQPASQPSFCTFAGDF